MRQKNTIGSTNKVKNALKQEIYHFYFHFTHILENLQVSGPNLQVFLGFFARSPDLHVLEVGRSARSRNTAYGTKRNSFELDSQRLHWANLLIKITWLCILQGKMYEE